MRALNAGCTTPLGARAVCNDQTITMWAVVLSPDGKRRVFAEANGRLENATAVGESVARQLLEEGTGALLARSEEA